MRVCSLSPSSVPATPVEGRSREAILTLLSLKLASPHGLNPRHPKRNVELHRALHGAADLHLPAALADGFPSGESLQIVADGLAPRPQPWHPRRGEHPDRGPGSQACTGSELALPSWVARLFMSRLAFWNSRSIDLQVGQRLPTGENS